MDDRQFDAVIRLLGSAAPRRAVTALLGSGLIGGTLATLGLTDAEARKKKRKKRKKKKCKGGKKKCGKKCIAATSCCSSADCGSNGVCDGGECTCSSGFIPCDGSCIPDDQCCTDADCGDLFLCARGTCVMGQGTCPDGFNNCQTPGNVCGQSPESECACFQSTTGDTRCGANFGLPGGACGECINDGNCHQLHPDVPGVFCVRGGPSCGCPDTQGFCMAPCSD